MYPTSVVAPRINRLPKIHRSSTPSYPSSQVGIINIWGGHGIGQHHVSLGWPTAHHLKNTQHFVQHIKEVELEPGEVMACYYVKAFFFSSHGPLHQHNKTKTTAGSTTLPKDQLVHTINVSLLEFCFKNTFLPLPRYYEQVHGAAIGSFIIP